NKDASIAPQVAGLRTASRSADVVVLCSYLPGVTGAVRQIRAAGIKLPILGQLGVDGRVISGGVPNLSNFFYVNVGSIHGDDPDARLDRLGRAYQKLVGTLKVQDYAPILGYAEVEAITAALKKTGGDTNGAKLAKAMEGFKNEPFLVKLTYSSKCHTPLGTPV